MASQRKAVRTTTVPIAATMTTRSDPRTILPMILSQEVSVPALNPEAGSGSTRDGSDGSVIFGFHGNESPATALANAPVEAKRTHPEKREALSSSVHFGSTLRSVRQEV